MLVFNNKRPNPNLVQDIIMQVEEFAFCASRPKGLNCRLPQRIRWDKPQASCLKLNTDGASNDLLGSAGGGGLIRDDRGSWVVGFSRRLGKANSLVAELWALRDGLLLCLQLNTPEIVIELDAKVIVEALNNPSFTNTVISPLIDDCKLLVSQMPHARIKHVFQEANLCADRLARLGCSQSLDFTLYSSPPVDLISFVEADCLGVFSDRLYPVSSFAL